MRPHLRIPGSLLAAFLLAAPAMSQTPYLVHDLGVGAQPSWPFEGPKEAPVGLGGLVLFFHDDGQHGRELWRSDGTNSGTFLIRDTCPGTCGAYSLASYGALARVGSRVFLVADDGVHGAELWVTDGTAGGTSMVLDIRPGLFGSNAKWFRAAAGLLFFLANDGVHGEELWRSDGTPAGTSMVKDLSANPEALAVVALQPGPGRLWMLAEGASDIAGLWTSDGTAMGTVRMIAGTPWGAYSGYGGRSPIAVLPGGAAVVQLGLGPSTVEVWRSDGTQPGTFKLRDPALAGNQVVAAGPWVFFEDKLPAATCPTLVQTDGTVAGTHVAAVPADSCVKLSTLAATAGDRLVFALSTPEEGFEPWATDGVTMTPLGDLVPGFWGSLNYPHPLYWAGGATVSTRQAVFAADDGTGDGRQLWVSDGSSAGTRRVTSFPPGSFPYLCPMRPTRYSLEEIGGALYLPGWDGNSEFVLWRVDLDAGGARSVASLPGEAPGLSARWAEDATYRDTPPDCFEIVGNRLLFGLPGNVVPAQLVSTDGSIGGLEPLWSVSYGSEWRCAAVEERALIFRADSNDSPVGYRLTTGLPEGTGGTFTPGYFLYGNVEPPLVNLGDRWALTSANSIWESDGTLEGSVAVASLDASLGGRIQLTGRAGMALFGSREVHAYSVAQGRTQLLHDFGAGGQLRGTAAMDFGFVMLGQDSEHGVELWWTDGTREGTRLTRDIAPGPRSAFSTRFSEGDGWFFVRTQGRLAPLGSRVLFAADDGVHGEELWVSDGTEAGTVLLGDLYPGSYPSTPRELVAAGDRVYFVAEHPWLGRELWVSDGTSDGTRVLVDLVAGSESSRPGDLAFLDGELYFSAWTATYGREAWRTDGVTKLTLRLTDIAPGSQSSSPGLFRRIGPRLFFAADDGLHGSELWAISDDGTVPLFHDDTESGSLLRWDAAQI